MLFRGEVRFLTIHLWGNPDRSFTLFSVTFCSFLSGVLFFAFCFYTLAHSSPAIDVLLDSLCLPSPVSTKPPFTTPLTGNARVPFYLVANVVEFYHIGTTGAFTWIPYSATAGFQLAYRAVVSYVGVLVLPQLDLSLSFDFSTAQS